MDSSASFTGRELDGLDAFSPGSGIFGLNESELDEYFSKPIPETSSQEDVNYLGDRPNNEGIISDDTLAQLLTAGGDYDAATVPACDEAVPQFPAVSAYNEFDHALAELELANQPVNVAGTVNGFTDIGAGHSQFDSDGEFASFLSRVTTGYNLEHINCTSLAANEFPAVAEEVAQVIKRSSSAASDELVQELSASTEAVEGAENQSNETTDSALDSTVTSNTESSAPPSSPHQETQPSSNQDDQEAMASSSNVTGIIKEEVTTEQPGDDGDEVTLTFSSAEEANEWPKRSPVPEDPTLPKSLEERKQIVREMIKAMRNVEEVEDNEHMVKPFRQRKHTTIRLEVVCWNLLDACIARHQSGPLLFGYEVKHNKTTSTVTSFQERKDDIINCLRTHKTICKHLLDPFYLYNFVDDPQGARQRVRSNKTLNKKKTEVMNAGKQALGKESTPTPAKKGGNKTIRNSEENDLPSPLPTPEKSALGSAAAQPATPVAANVTTYAPNGYFPPAQQAGAGATAPTMSSPSFDMSSSMSGSEESSVLNSPVHNTSSYGHVMFDTMGSLNGFAGHGPFGTGSIQNVPTITYPTGRSTRDFSPIKPSGLQNVFQNVTLQEGPHGLPASTSAAGHFNIQPLSFPPVIPPQDTPQLQQQPSGLSASRTPFGRGPKRPRTDNTEGSDSSGSPKKRRR